MIKSNLIKIVYKDSICVIDQDKVLLMFFLYKKVFWIIYEYKGKMYMFGQDVQLEDYNLLSSLVRELG